MNALRTIALVGFAAIMLAACKPPPVNRTTTVPLPTVAAVDVERYLGRWHEIARLPNSFEENCFNVTADYSRNDDGSIRVLNTCRDKEGNVTETADGEARIVDAATNARLEVSFFGPFWGDYWIIGLADDYSWALVGEPSGRYLWILARSTEISPELTTDLLSRLTSLGYDTTKLEYP